MAFGYPAVAVAGLMPSLSLTVKSVSALRACSEEGRADKGRGRFQMGGTAHLAWSAWSSILNGRVVLAVGLADPDSTLSSLVVPCWFRHV